MKEGLPRGADLLGQDAALASFESALTGGRLAPAYLLHGPEGVGRALGARLFAAVLLCAAPTGIEPCGRCRPCQLEAAGTHPDHLIVTADRGPTFRDDRDAERSGADVFTLAARRGAKQTPRRQIAVRSIRRLLSALSLAAAAGNRKVAVIDSFDEVEEEGAATLLKTLEDARPDTTFLLLAGTLDTVPDTILSRCQRLRFQPLSPQIVRQILLAEAADLVTNPVDVKFLVGLGQGSAGRAIAAARLGVHRVGVELVTRLVEHGDATAAAAAIEWVRAGKADLREQRERTRALIGAVLLRLRDAVQSGGGISAVERLDAWTPVVTTALETLAANVAPDLVLRALWVRGERAGRFSRS